MSDAVLFSIIFVGLFVLRFVVATIVFFWIIPEGDRCPMCDAPTIRVESRAFNAVMPWFRTSWCLHCHWKGVLRHGKITRKTTKSEHLTRR
jgi:hypothetical protein